MTNTTDYREPQGKSITEHLVFVALLLPTILVLVAAIVSLASPEPTFEGDRPMVTAAACETCRGQDGDDGP
jgi:hypothetical protein